MGACRMRDTLINAIDALGDEEQQHIEELVNDIRRKRDARTGFSRSNLIALQAVVHSKSYNPSTSSFNYKLIDRIMTLRYQFGNLLLFGVYIVLAVWLFFFAINLQYFGGMSVEATGGGESARAQWGQFGDAFNMLNTLFTGLAFVGVVVTLLLQRKDFEASLLEINESTKAQKRLAEETSRERRDRHAELYQVFNSNDMYAARTEMWPVALFFWFESDEIRSNLDWYSPRRRGQPIRIADNKLKHCTLMLDFYSYLYRLYINENETGMMKEQARRYYYPAWRGFLLSFVSISIRSFEGFGISGRPDENYLDPRFQDILDLDERIYDGESYDIMNDPFTSHVLRRKELDDQYIKEEFYPGFNRIVIDRTKAEFS